MKQMTTLEIIATTEAISYHIENLDEIENALELYTKDSISFIENLATVKESYSCMGSSYVVHSIDDMVERTMFMWNKMSTANAESFVEWTAERIVKLLLGGDTELDCYAVNIDGTLVFPTECSNGYEDHDEPVISAYTNDDDEEPFMELTMNEFANAVVGETSFKVQSNVTGEVFEIRPLTSMKLK